MASSKKSSILGLNLWAETDKPERKDFVEDNQRVDDLLGTHINTSALHLTLDEKARAQEPFRFFSYSGNGKATQTYTLPFAPRMVFVMASSKADGIVENGLQGIFRAMRVGSHNTPGLTISNLTLGFSQQTEEEAQAAGNGYRIRLNEKGVVYCAVAFR